MVAFMDNKKSDLEKFKENVDQYNQGNLPDLRDSAEDEATRPSEPLQKPRSKAKEIGSDGTS
jgi:hypothetical protein